jgi:deazaflavin-dependent oxidoreductase (nitroreductase family)
MADFNEEIIKQFRENDGVVEHFGDRLVLLTTTGAKSGLPRTTPVMSTVADDGETLYVFASFAGAPQNPDWFVNLEANPAVHVEYRTEAFDATAEVLAEPQRSEVYAKQAAAVPQFAEYQEKTDRVIPVVALRRR